MRKELESFYLNMARNVYSGFPNIEPIDCEAPDFLFRKEKTVIGVEVTNFIRGLASASITMRTAESLRERVAERAQRRFESRNQVALRVALHWNEQFRFSKKQVDPLSAELASLVESVTPSGVYEGAVCDANISGDLPIFCAVSRISIRRLRDESKGLWTAIEAGFVEVDIANLHGIVARKESKVDSYAEQCDEVWLLIVADSQHISSSLELKSKTGPALATRFSRVLLYNVVSDTVTQLR